MRCHLGSGPNYAGGGRQSRARPGRRGTLTPLGWDDGVDATNLAWVPFGKEAMMRGKALFDFLGSRGARKNCPLCGHEEWYGEAFPLTCANCGFIRLQSAHVLDDPRTPGQQRTDPQSGSDPPPGRARN
jgi:hypothetical protein